MTNEQEEMIIKHFRCPDVKLQARWEEDLRDSFVYGCDWLEAFAEKWNPVHAAAVEEMVLRLEEIDGSGR